MAWETTATPNRSSFFFATCLPSPRESLLKSWSSHQFNHENNGRTTTTKRSRSSEPTPTTNHGRRTDSALTIDPTASITIPQRHYWLVIYRRIKNDACASKHSIVSSTDFRIDTTCLSQRVYLPIQCYSLRLLPPIKRQTIQLILFWHNAKCQTAAAHGVWYMQHD